MAGLGSPVRFLSVGAALVALVCGMVACVGMVRAPGSATATQNATPATTADDTPPNTAAPQEITLRVMAFNDLHGHLESAGLTMTLRSPLADAPGNAAGDAPLRVATGGAAALAGLAHRLRADVPHSVLVSSGDLFGATPLVSALFRHESTIEAMNLAGLDVGAVGNHEFDAGQDELRRLIEGGCGGPNPASQSCALKAYRGARFAVLAANVVPTQAHMAPSWVYQAGTVKVGFIGAVTRSTPQIVVPAGVAGLSFIDEAQAINEAARDLKARGVHALVVTLHEGGETGEPGKPADWNDTRCPGLRGPIVDIAQRITPDVDLILSGHTHQGYNCLLQGRHLLQAGALGRGLSVVDLTLNARSGRVIRERTVARNLPVFNEHTDPAHRQALAAQEPSAFAAALREASPDSRVAALVAQYAQAAAPQARRVVGRIQATMDRRGRTDTAAGRLVADAQWNATRAAEQGGSQFALMNPGGVRSDLSCNDPPPCDVSYGDLFAVQPFGNTLTVMSLKGAQIRQLLEDQQRPGRNSPWFMSPSAGLSYRWKSSAPYGQRVQELLIGGQPAEDAREYRLTVNSFMAEGGDGASVLREGYKRIGGPLDLDALQAYLARGAAGHTAPRIVWVD